VGLILLILAALAVIAVVVVNRTSGPRPDRPMAGKDDDDAASRRDETTKDSTWTTDQAGGPGQEAMNPDEPGDPSPGPGDDRTP
jgi:hypothetical protein